MESSRSGSQTFATVKIATTAMVLSIGTVYAGLALGETLKGPAEFNSIVDRAARSRAIFNEVGKLIANPRCMNCHPAGDRPLQGNDQHEHMPPVWRAESGHFEVPCSECHSSQNTTLYEGANYQSIPGHPRWGFAPLSMSWQYKSPREICLQIKDVQLNGGRDLVALQEHIAKDDLVGWAWNPNKGREPAPGTQEQAGRPFQTWIDSGAECPEH